MPKNLKTNQTPCILLVEPDVFLSDIYEKNLQMEDFKVIKAVSGERALSLIKSKEINLVLLSLNLPKMNGFEVLETIRSSDKSGRLPVIILSKLGAKEDVDKARLLGADQFVIKAHFHPSEIVDKVKKIIFRK